MTIKDRIYGSLFGFAVGDAMGAIPEPWLKALNPDVTKELNECAEWVLKQLS